MTSKLTAIRFNVPIDIRSMIVNGTSLAATSEASVVLTGSNGVALSSEMQESTEVPW